MSWAEARLQEQLLEAQRAVRRLTRERNKLRRIVKEALYLGSDGSVMCRYKEDTDYRYLCPGIQKIMEKL